MKVPLKWLSEFVRVDRSVEELSHLLTMSGLEVESIATVGQLPAEFVTARIVETRPHPNAERLTLCMVETETGNARQVVCGARNMKSGDIVVLAQTGAVLPDGKKIERAKLRGESSEGMLCSARELGISGDHDGIMILPPGTAVGAPFAQVYAGADTVLDVSITPNRADCLSILGIARDVAALTGVAFEPAREAQVTARAGATPARLTVEAPDLCPTYYGRVIDGVRIGPSPSWVVARLSAAGVRSINNVVDATNYVLLERGQPLHAFDLDKLAGGHVIVRRARPGEKLATLDGAERAVDERDLLICDDSGGVAIAGVMGGASSAVSSDTRRLLLEAAWFHPDSVRATARRVGLHTDASHRFERGVDPDGVLKALDAVTELILQTAGGEVVGETLAALAPRQAPGSIQVNPDRVNALLGLAVPAERMKAHFEALQMRVEPAKGGFAVVAPSYRLDIEQEADLAEEVARLEGYENLPTTRPLAELQSPSAGSSRKTTRAVVSYLTSHGLDQVINYAFIHPQQLSALRLAESDPRLRPIALVNPLTEDLSVMRTMLLPSLLKAAVHNERHQNPDVRIFEVGKVFLPTGESVRPAEPLRLGCLLMGRREARGWTASPSLVDIFDLKGVLEGLAAHFRLTAVSLLEAEAEPFLVPGQAWTVRSGSEAIGYFGALHPEVARTVGLESSAYVIELDVAKLLSGPQAARRFSALPRFPSVSRDLAVLVDEGLSSEELTRVIRDAGGALLESVTLFDVFRGKNIPAGRKSVACGLVYRSPERTLVESDIQAIHERVLAALEGLGAHLRA